jgi:predicted AlkP superfamily pyrophosphatase or phosphodiesterase
MRAILALPLLLIASFVSAASPQHAPRLVLVSIDGFRPVFYTQAKYRKLAPTLASLSDQGERAPHGIEPIFPSITYPNHISMVTGAYSAEHGIYNNRIYSKTEGNTQDWYWYERDIRVPTLWQKAKQAGLRVALFRWPASTGAKVDWQLPEIFAGSGGFDAEKDWEVIHQHVDLEFLKKVLDSGPVKKLASVSDLDQIDTQAAEYVLKNENPDLVIIHLIDLDHIQHLFGTDAPEVDRSLQGIDALVARIFRFLDPQRTTVIVTGDHGFASYTRTIHLPTLIAAAGLSDQVDGPTDGGQAAVYAKAGAKKPATEADCRKLLETSKKYGKKLMRLIARKELDRLHAYPGALCALEANLGTVFTLKPSTTPDVVEELKQSRGHHGYLSSRPEMRAGFFIWGKGTHSGLLPADPKMPDIAPTAASILGIPFSVPSGRQIRF